jgi:hypothetical protein
MTSCAMTNVDENTTHTLHEHDGCMTPQALGRFYEPGDDQSTTGTRQEHDIPIAVVEHLFDIILKYCYPITCLFLRPHLEL